MWTLVLSMGIGALLGSALGYFGQCSSGTCPLTSTWWRGAMYGAALGALFGFGSTRSESSETGASSTNVLHIAESDFASVVLKSDQPVLVDFYAPWCGPCKTMAPRVARVADEYAGRLKVAKVNVDEATELAGRLRIQGIPTLVFFKDGKPVDTSVGLISEQELRAKAAALLNSKNAMSPGDSPGR